MQKHLILALVILSALIGAFSYQHLPEQVASHWNSQGTVDDTLPRFWGAFLLPLILAGLYVFYKLIPRIEPNKKNIQLFKKQYDTFMLILFSFLFVAYLFTILWNLGVQINPSYVFPLGLAALFYYIGILCKHAKRNYFIGIRTPWTLASDDVWQQTHQLGSTLFKLNAAIALASVLAPAHALLITLVPLAVNILILFAYSYYAFQK